MSELDEQQTIQWLQGLETATGEEHELNLRNFNTLKNAIEAANEIIMRRTFSFDMSKAPKDREILTYGPSGYDICKWHEEDQGSPDQPGFDAGWIGQKAFPASHFDGEDAVAVDQPVGWMEHIGVRDDVWEKLTRCGKCAQHYEGMRCPKCHVISGHVTVPKSTE